MPTYLAPGVYMEEISSGSKPISGVGTAIAAFVGLAEKGPVDTPTLVTNWSQFTQTFGEFVEGSYLAHSVYGYFLNGGGVAYIVRVGGNGADEAPPARAEIPSAADKAQASYRFQALEAGAAGDEISVEFADPSEPAEDTFNLVVRRGKTEETYPNVTTKKGPNNVVTQVKQKSKIVSVEEVAKGGAVAIPEKGKFALGGGGAPVPVSVTPDSYVGNSADRTGFGGLEAIDEITMLAVPDLMAAYQQGALDMEGLKGVQLAMIAHCELMNNRVCILDAPPGLNAQQVKEWRMDMAGYDSKQAALYWPWIKVMDPVKGEAIHIPPSGHMAGIWARTDDTRGVHKAPANEVIRGAISLELQITKGEQEQLNPIGVNCIRSFPGKGIRVWGARTLSSDPEWRYLNVRRLFNMVEQSILNGTDWTVFEPNDFRLWLAVRRNVNAFLRNVWRSGALFGEAEADAFWVKCDEENNPPESRDLGELHVDIGIAPVKPAEFVVFRIQQIAASSE